MRLSHCPFGTSNSASSSHLIPILAQWITYFEHFREERVMQQIQHPPVQQAYENLHALSADKKAWYQQLAREMAQHDEATLREEAEARGEARGKAAGQASILRRQLRAKFGTLPTFAEEQLRHARSGQLENWAERVLFAETLEQVFSEH